MRIKHLATLIGASLFFAATSVTWAAGEPLTVVYWSAKDCR